MSVLEPIVLQNYFELPSEEIFFQDRAPVRNIDSRNRSFGFYSCPISLDPLLAGEFCNTIEPIADSGRGPSLAASHSRL